ncbi:MAG: hypothetical protein K2J85_02685 [Anaeroplasmataceae bacterium]|nr:hypothetical protein [Anaeroplasmataceae bacterium]
MNDNKEVNNRFWMDYVEELIEELNFRLVLDWFDSVYPLTNTILRVESIEFKEISSRKKKNWLMKFWYFIKRLFKKKRKKE